MRGYQTAASFCRQVAAWLPDMFWNCYLVKNHKIAKNSTTTKAREKICADSESLEFKKIYVCLTKFENYQILLNKISHRFLVTTRWEKEPHWPQGVLVMPSCLTLPDLGSIL